MSQMATLTILKRVKGNWLMFLNVKCLIQDFYRGFTGRQLLIYEGRLTSRAYMQHLRETGRRESCRLDVSGSFFEMVILTYSNFFSLLNMVKKYNTKTPKCKLKYTEICWVFFISMSIILILCQFSKFLQWNSCFISFFFNFKFFIFYCNSPCILCSS